MRRGVAWLARACGWTVLLGAAAGTAGARAAAPSSEGRFTITRILPGGRTEVRSVTLEELKAMGRPSTAPPTAAGAVVFDLPPPVPDPVAPAAAAPAMAQAQPLIQGAPEPAPARRGAGQTPSAAAIRVATAGRAALRAPIILSGGWTLLSKDDPAAAVDADADAPPQGRGGARPGKRKGSAAPLGVRDGKSFGEQGRFYLYAGVKNRGVGLNLTDHNGAESGGWGSDGVSYDRGGFSGQRSAGLGWRQGDVATSLGWVHEKNNIKGMYGAPAEKDDRVALTFSWRPSVR